MFSLFYRKWLTNPVRKLSQGKIEKSTASHLTSERERTPSGDSQKGSRSADKKTAARFTPFSKVSQKVFLSLLHMQK